MACLPDSFIQPQDDALKFRAYNDFNLFMPKVIFLSLRDSIVVDYSPSGQPSHSHVHSRAQGYRVQNIRHTVS